MDDITPSTTTLMRELRLNSGGGHQVALADHLAYAFCGTTAAKLRCWFSHKGDGHAGT